jgi:hypothetical protein
MPPRARSFAPPGENGSAQDDAPLRLTHFKLSHYTSDPCDSSWRPDLVAPLVLLLHSCQRLRDFLYVGHDRNVIVLLPRKLAIAVDDIYCAAGNALI